ncbi:MAG: ankyrin repeat domain-containing protein [Sulfitobacter sp.]
MQRLFTIFCFLFGLLAAGFAVAQPSEIMIAARSGDLEQVRELLASGAEPDPSGIATPLIFAAQGGHLEIVELLLEHGADPNANSNLGSPLQVAAQRGHLDVSRILLQFAADPNAAGGEFDNTPLHEAAKTGDVEIGRLLISHGADVNIQNKKYEPPIHLAMLRNRIAFVELVRAAGAAAIAVEPITEDLADADLTKGRILAVVCTNCHWLEKDAEETDSYGPRLWGIVGRQIAIAHERERFPYSEAMKAQTGNWTFERLNAFLADPSGSIPGQGMYKGTIKDKTERINLIAYLRTLADDPVPLP